VKPQNPIQLIEGFKVRTHDGSTASTHKVPLYGITEGFGGDEREATRARDKVEGKSLIADSLTRLHGCPYFIARG
jgi:hypothetical protein